MLLANKLEMILLLVVRPKDANICQCFNIKIMLKLIKLGINIRSFMIMSPNDLVIPCHFV